MSFLTPVDIANRALQHCGAPQIDAFTDDSVQANEVAFAYDKLRRAELRRNVWRFATRMTTLRPLTLTTMLISPTLWGSTITYFIGSLVTDSSGTIWVSNAANNLANTPGSTPQWEIYFGPMTCDAWVDPTATPALGAAYGPGELAYVAPGDGTYQVFMSLTTGNTDNPTTPDIWSATNTYFKGMVISYLGSPYQSMIDLNVNQLPTSSQNAWAVATTYSTGNLVYGSDGFVYRSVGNGNTGNDPTQDNGTHWTNTAVLNAWTQTITNNVKFGSPQWEAVSVALSQIELIWPLGAGPLTSTFSLNVYHLPGNFLREAPQDPKAGSVSFLGSPSGRQYDDWVFQGDYFTTRESEPIVFRFVCDIASVPAMDDMFCEGLAARLGMEVVQRITQSDAKMGAIASVYKMVMGEARTVNGIETGSVEPPEDDWVTCRV